MTESLPGAGPAQVPAERFRLHRAGVLNVWQYDEQVFEFAGGRMLLRGANGAGKSKTLEMLLPFVLDGDKNRMTASGRHHTSLLWLMTDGYDGQARLGYLWVEFERGAADGSRETLTCAVGVRASQSARTAACWYFTTPRRFGEDLVLEDDTGPLSKERCRDAIGPDGHFFESPRQYKEHVGRTLFGLDVGRYDELLRLLYWLRQPQVGEDIDPPKLAGMLSVALPELDESALRSAGDTFDELAAFGEQIERRQKAAEALTTFATLYSGYARTVARSRGAAVVEADRELRRRINDVAKARREVDEVQSSTAAAEAEQRDAEQRKAVAETRLRQLETSPEAQSELRLLELDQAATSTEGHADRAEREYRLSSTRAETIHKRLADDAELLTNQLRQVVTEAHSGAAIAERTGVTAALDVPAPLRAPVLTEAAEAEHLLGAIGEFAGSVAAARQAIGGRQAEITTVDAARSKFVAADAKAAEHERAASHAEQQAEQAQERRARADAAAATSESAFEGRLDAWRSHEAAQPIDLPDELDAATVPMLPSLARQAVEPRLTTLRRAEADAASTRVTAERELAALRARRDQVAAERDPAPAPPALPRTSRDGVPGAPLWRLVDFGPAVADTERAGIEAALEAAGLLDAWVRPDGTVLNPERFDVVLPLGDVAPSSSLGDVLLPVGPDGSDVTVATVYGVLSRISLVDPDAAAPASASAAVCADGRWWLGPLVGRAAKQAAQYVGAGARAAERLRRLAELDQEIAEIDARRRLASTAEATARVALEAADAWLDHFPSYAELIEGWALLDAATAEAARADTTARKARELAQAARATAAGCRAELHRLADGCGLPVDTDVLTALRDELRGLDERWRRCEATAAAQLPAVRSWQRARTELATDVTRLAELAVEASELRRSALQARAASDTEHEKVGASVRELQDKLTRTRAEIGTHRAQAEQLGNDLRVLSERHGAARTEVTVAEQRRAEHEPFVRTHAHALATLADVPGLLAASEVDTQAHIGAIRSAHTVDTSTRLPADVAKAAGALAAIEVDRAVEEAAVWRGHQELAAGPAADAEPRIVPIDGVLATLARDETGEHPVTVVAGRLAARVAQDRELLTDRERRLFEDHILGDLGDVLRSRRIEAEELVAAMNRLLDGISTSQGIRVTLSWRLRDDVPPDARRAVELLGKSLGALLPDERRDLRDALHRLIEASRAEEPELSYTEHLTRSLDYRQWFAFRIRYTRPETPGKWHDLHRRSALSQGEQKVVCYLPLFAAAAAHFTSVAGAAPHAPRFVLLDDAFPKIDVRTHPLLFGLLVDLDLDFVVTSERLWGDHATVPSLAIYEALRDPMQRGIAQYRHTWDGQRLRVVGA